MRNQLHLISVLGLALLGSSCAKDSQESQMHSDTRSTAMGNAAQMAASHEAPGKLLRPSCDLKIVTVGERVLVGDGSTKLEGLITLGGGGGGETIPDPSKIEEIEVEEARWIHAYDLLERGADGEPRMNPRWSRVELSEPRKGLAMVRLGNQVLIAGGARPVRDFLPGMAYDWKKHLKRTVDVYDHGARRVVRQMELSEARSNALSVAVGGKAYFIGGFNGNTSPSGALHQSGVDYFRSDVVDIYDSKTDTWSKEKLLGTVQISRATVINGRVALSRTNYWDGEYEFFDPATGEHGVTRLENFDKNRFGSQMLLPSLLARWEDYLVMGTSSVTPGMRDNLEIFHEPTKTWKSLILSFTSLGQTATRAGDSVVFAAGEHFSIGPDRMRHPEPGAHIVNPRTGVTTPTTLSVPRQKIVSATVLDRYAVFIGGWLGNGSVATVDVFDGDNKEWLYEDGFSREKVEVWESNDQGEAKPREAILYGTDLSFVPYPELNEVRVFRSDRKRGRFELAQTLFPGRFPRYAYRIPGTNTVVVSSVYSSTLSVYRIGPEGVLREIPASPYKTPFEAPSGPAYSVAVDLLYVPSFKTKAYAAYQVADDGSLSQIDQSVFAGFPFKLPDFQASRDGRVLYGTDPVSEYFMSFGMLYLLMGQGQIGGHTTGMTRNEPASEPWNVVLHPWESWSNQRWWAYAGLSQLGKVGLFYVDPIGGGLRPRKQIAPTAIDPRFRTVPAEGAMSDDGGELYFLDRGAGAVLRYDVDPVSGELSERTPIRADLGDEALLERCRKIGC